MEIAITEGGYSMFMAGISGGGKPVGVIDYIRHSTVWQTREELRIPGSGRDTYDVMARNAEDNLKLGGLDWALLWGKEKDRSCILLAPGPSLKESFEEIRKQKKEEDAFIVGVNLVIAAPIELDYFVYTTRRSREEYYAKKKTYTTLIAATTAHSPCCATFEKRYWGEMMDGKVDAGMSVLTCRSGNAFADSVMACYMLGASKITMYGCDYAVEAVEKDGRIMMGSHYWDGRTAKDDRYLADKEPHEHYMMLRGVNDRPIFTTPNLMFFRGTTEGMCRSVVGSGIPVWCKAPAGIFRYGRDEEEIKNELGATVTPGEIIDVNPYDLIFPNRLDLWFRVEFLKQVEESGGDFDLMSTAYAFHRMYMYLSPDKVEEKLQEFVNVTRSIKAFGYPRYRCSEDYIVIAPNADKAGPKYQLVDGAHRLAAAIHTGMEKVPCRLRKEPFEGPDYTAGIKRSFLSKISQIQKALESFEKAKEEKCPSG
jgi:hypothetical protein